MEEEGEGLYRRLIVWILKVLGIPELACCKDRMASASFHNPFRRFKRSATDYKTKWSLSVVSGLFQP